MTAYNFDERSRYEHRRISTMMQTMIGKEMSAKYGSANFEIRLRQSIDGIVLSPGYFVKVTEALVKIDEFFEPAVHMRKRETDRGIETSLECEKRFRRLSRAAEKTVSVYS